MAQRPSPRARGCEEVLAAVGAFLSMLLLGGCGGGTGPNGADAPGDPLDAARPPDASVDAPAPDTAASVDAGAADAGAADDAGAFDVPPEDAPLAYSGLLDAPLAVDAGTDARACAAETCDGLDDDCDGVVDEALTAPACSLVLGVCATSNARCEGALGWRCDYGPAYEATETTCDGFDGDCDGTTDEGCTCALGSPCGAQTQARWESASDLDPWALEQLAGGAFAIAGDYGSSLSALPLVMTADIDGALRWAFTYGTTTRVHLRDVEPLPDGGMVVVGSVEAGAPTFDDALVMRLDASGDVTWAQRLGASGNEHAFGVEASSDTIFVAGDVGANVLFVELALDGTPRRALALDAPGTLESAHDLALVGGVPVLYGNIDDATRAGAFVYPVGASRGVRVIAYDATTHRIRATADGGLLVSGYTQSSASDTGSAFSARLDASLGLTFFHSHSETYSDLYDTVELRSGRSLAGGSMAWAFLESLGAAGTGGATIVYRPLAPSGRNEVRAIVPLADGGFAAIAQDGGRRLWFLRGNAAGEATSCNREPGWWSTTNATRATASLTFTSSPLTLTTTPVTLAPTAVAPTVTAVCSAPMY